MLSGYLAPNNCGPKWKLFIEAPSIPWYLSSHTTPKRVDYYPYSSHLASFHIVRLLFISINLHVWDMHKRHAYLRPYKEIRYIISCKGLLQQIQQYCYLMSNYRINLCPCLVVEVLLKCVCTSIPYSTYLYHSFFLTLVPISVWSRFLVI